MEIHACIPFMTSVSSLTDARLDRQMTFDECLDPVGDCNWDEIVPVNIKKKHR